MSKANVPKVASQIARWHHERWDGSGYPDGLRGENIPLAVRAVTVADTFDALTSQRPYKPAWRPELAMAEIMTKAGSQFDPEVARAFAGLWEAGVVDHILRCERSRVDKERKVA